MSIIKQIKKAIKRPPFHDELKEQSIRGQQFYEQMKYLGILKPGLDVVSNPHQFNPEYLRQTFSIELPSNEPALPHNSPKFNGF